MVFTSISQVFIVGILMLSTAGCTLLGRAPEPLVLEYAASETQPIYQPGLRYLPIADAATLTWVVLAEQKPVIGTPQPLSIWYGQGDRMLRTHGGKLVEVVGYAQEPLRLADNCPYLSHLRNFRPTDCTRTYMTQRAGVYMARVKVRQLPPEPIKYRFGDTELPGNIVREQLSAAGRQGNFYLFDNQGRYIMSRQWLDDARSFDLFAAEQAQ